MLKAYIREVLLEMSTRYKREKGENLPRWKERLIQYADSGEHFVHFSFYPKLGLNPLNNFDTPTGFYAYPLQRGQISSFATERPYAVVVSLNESGNFLYLDRYSEDDLQRDIEKLQGKFGLTQAMEDEGRDNARVKTPGGILWNITRLLSISRGGIKKTETNLAWTKQKQDHYEDLVWIAQTLAGRSASERQEIIDEFFLENSRDAKFNPGLRERWKRLYNLAKAMPEDYTPAEIKRQAETQKEFTVNPRMSNWTGILRQLGYDGVIDYGEKIIHPSEPFQGVFFSTGDLNLMDIIHKGAGSDMSELLPEEEPSFEVMKGYYFSDEDFTGKISPTLFSKSEFVDCTFRGVDFSGIVANGCKFVRCTFTDCDLKGAAFLKCLFDSCLIESPDADLSTLNLSGSVTGGLKVLPPNTIMPKGFKLNASSGLVMKG